MSPDLIVTGHPDGAALLQCWFDPETRFQTRTQTVAVFPTWWAANAARPVAQRAADQLQALLSKESV